MAVPLIRGNGRRAIAGPFRPNPILYLFANFNFSPFNLLLYQQLLTIPAIISISLKPLIVFGKHQS
jgi:hypothetical protein